MKEYPYGTSVEVKGVFKDQDAALYDPTTVRCLIQVPALTQTTYTYGTDVALVRESIGVYSMWFLPATVGRYVYRWKGTGPQSVARERMFNVVASAFTAP